MNCECGCGCGQETKMGRGGQPNKYAHGHNPTPRPPGPGWMDQGRWFVSVEGQTIARARFVMQQTLGRALGPDEIVVHRDGDQLNDDLRNLQVLSRSEYMRIHLPRRTAQWSGRDLIAAVWLYTAGSMTIGEVALQVGKSYG